MGSDFLEERSKILEENETKTNDNQIHVRDGFTTTYEEEQKRRYNSIQVKLTFFRLK